MTTTATTTTTTTTTTTITTEIRETPCFETFVNNNNNYNAVKRLEEIEKNDNPNDDVERSRLAWHIDIEQKKIDSTKKRLDKEKSTSTVEQQKQQQKQQSKIVKPYSTKGATGEAKHLPRKRSLSPYVIPHEKIIYDTTKSIENDDDDEAALETSEDNVLHKNKKNRKDEPPQLMLLILVKPDGGDPIMGFEAPFECKSAKKIMALLRRCLNATETSTYPPCIEQFVSAMNTLFDFPNSSKDEFIIDFKYYDSNDDDCYCGEDEDNDENENEEEEYDEKLDKFNVKKLIGSELRLWNSVSLDTFTTLEDNPTKVHHICAIDRFT